MRFIRECVPDMIFGSGFEVNKTEEMQGQHQHEVSHKKRVCGYQFNNLINYFYPKNHCYPLLADNKRSSQDFQYFVVIDLEATCDKEMTPQPQETIEFSSVLVNSMNGQIEDSFQIYVRPTFHQTLTDFCKELTGIQQDQVDGGVSLSEALFMHDKWLDGKGIKNTNFAVVTWTNWDCEVLLETECRLKKFWKPSYFNRWINLKAVFKKVFRAWGSLKQALEKAELSWEGRAHSALDDARNTARLLTLIMHLGFRFYITNSLEEQPTHPALTWQQSPYQKLRQHISCLCGVETGKHMIRYPGPSQGSFFYGCGNWTTKWGPLCCYFQWA